MGTKLRLFLLCLLVCFLLTIGNSRAGEAPAPQGWVKHVIISVKTPDGSKVDGTFVIRTREINKNYRGKIRRNRGGKYIVCATSAHDEFNHTVTVSTKFGQASKNFRTFEGHCDNDMTVRVKY